METIQVVYFLLGIIGGFISLGVLIWNSSRNYTKKNDDLENKIDNTNTKLDNLSHKIEEHIEDSKLQEQKLYALDRETALNTALLKRHDDDIKDLKVRDSNFTRRSAV